MIERIEKLKNFVLLEEKNINEKTPNRNAIRKAKTKTQKRNAISIQKSFLKNAATLLDKRYVIIDAFENNDILSKNLEEDVYLEKESEYEESIAERTKMRRQDQQSAKGLTILTPEQMLSRLQISLSSIESRK